MFGICGVPFGSTEEGYQKVLPQGPAQMVFSQLDEESLFESIFTCKAWARAITLRSNTYYWERLLPRRYGIDNLPNKHPYQTFIEERHRYRQMIAEGVIRKPFTGQNLMEQVQGNYLMFIMTYANTDEKTYCHTHQLKIFRIREHEVLMDLRMKSCGPPVLCNNKLITLNNNLLFVEDLEKDSINIYPVEGNLRIIGIKNHHLYIHNAEQGTVTAYSIDDNGVTPFGKTILGLQGDDHSYYVDNDELGILDGKKHFHLYDLQTRVKKWSYTDPENLGVRELYLDKILVESWVWDFDNYNKERMVTLLLDRQTGEVVSRVKKLTCIGVSYRHPQFVIYKGLRGKLLIQNLLKSSLEPEEFSDPETFTKITVSAKKPHFVRQYRDTIVTCDELKCIIWRWNGNDLEKIRSQDQVGIVEDLLVKGEFLYVRNKSGKVYMSDLGARDRRWCRVFPGSSSVSAISLFGNRLIGQLWSGGKFVC